MLRMKNHHNFHMSHQPHQHIGPPNWQPHHFPPQSNSGWHQRQYQMNTRPQQYNNRGRQFRIQSAAMPKRNSRANSRQWRQEDSWAGEPQRNYYEHDDRDRTRRVSFMSKNRLSKTGRKRDVDVPGRSHLNDDDVEMAGTAFMAAKGRYKYNYKGGPGPSRDSRVGPRNRGARHVQIANGPSGAFPLQETDKWYRILIPYGGKYEKNYIIRILRSYVTPFVFVPIAYRVSNNDATFYVDDFKAALILAKANKKITTTDGFKLVVKAFPGVPNINIDDRFKEKLLTAMRGRFNAETKALDLRKFHTDPNLVDDVLAATYRPPVLTAIVDLIAENIPELVGLNLDENHLFVVEPLAALARKTPNLQVLHLGKNRIRDIRKLDCLKGLKLVELFLDGNPLCDRFNEESAYVSEVRKIFPKVVRLDGADLPPPIIFDVTEEVKLPPYVVSFVCSPEGQQVAKQFLEQYFLIYDSDNRDSLADAYHDNAQFSLAVTVPKDGNHKLGQYIERNRNLMRIRDASRRLRALTTGKANVVSKLKELPLTKHDLASFTVDLPLFNETLMFLNISGVFVEPKLVNMPTRFFSRTFVIVPLGSGFVILNDMLNITNATEKQAKIGKELKKSFFKKAAFTKPVLDATPVATPIASPVSSPSAPAAVPDEVKEQMVVAMCRQTTMNAVWSRKCLEENRWDFNAAVAVFTQLHSDQKVPPDAFIH